MAASNVAQPSECVGTGVFINTIYNEQHFPQLICPPIGSPGVSSPNRTSFSRFIMKQAHDRQTDMIDTLHATGSPVSVVSCIRCGQKFWRAAVQFVPYPVVLDSPFSWYTNPAMSVHRRRVLSVSVCVSVGEFSFLGSLILEAVVAELATLHGLSAASDVYLAGARCVLV